DTRPPSGILVGIERGRKKAMPHHFDQDWQELPPNAGKLTLPAPSEPTLQAFPQTSPAPTFSEQTTAYAPHSLVPPNFRVNQRRGVWRKDPAYLVLACAIALVMISAIAFVAFGATAILNNNSLAASQTFTTATPSGTLGAQPNLSTPTPSPGNNQTNPSPVVPTPNLNPPPSPTNPPQPAPSSLSVQIVNLPSVVPNDSRVLVDVQSNQPGIQVKLQVSYNVPSLFVSSGTHITDENGQVVLPWTVRVFLRNNSARATVQVIALNQHGQQVSSQAVVVTIEG
ncbi:MAG: hypothetical protein ACRDHZ_05365, partial [Ktedonobacteraceae bacterium]